MLSNSFSRVISHAREEYLYVYSVYVLEASTSNRLTHFYPPFNLVALAIFRPCRLFLPSDDKFRAARILLLKATHFPIVGAILLYEAVRGRVVGGGDDRFAGFKGPANLPDTTNNTTTAASTGETPRRKASRARMRPVSSSSQHRPLSMSIFEPFAPAPPGPPLPPPQGRVFSGGRRPSRRSVSSAVVGNADQDDDDMEPPTEVEVQIAVLSTKIDTLVDMMLALQKKDKQDDQNQVGGD